MACDTTLRQGQTFAQRAKEVADSLAELKKRLRMGQAKIVIAPNGAVTFAGWEDRRGLSDACTLRSLQAEGSFEFRQALQKAEATSGRRVNMQAVSAGFHSHDGGRTWGRH